MSYRDAHSFESRRTQALAIRAKHPDRIPVIVEKRPRDATLPLIDKKKFLVPADLTVGQFVYVIRKRIALKPEQAIFLFVMVKVKIEIWLMVKVYVGMLAVARGRQGRAKAAKRAAAAAEPSSASEDAVAEAELATVMASLRRFTVASASSDSDFPRTPLVPLVLGNQQPSTGLSTGSSGGCSSAEAAAMRRSGDAFLRWFDDSNTRLFGQSSDVPLPESS
ncbi:hypothetical protein EMIHUDRAFT_216066 [Emiliania huxleyi CCMP1516]|uniref:Autophagy-related protein n=2 Tax=Emiliania huxleyi TaxID=2903 RepID=A0A0D3IFD0_EMIH1|nr:hypothetical protein EMIHUDRAFT_216066 [Emiliania huxleyi CCMP1516]EOD09965.1 hypothetical protein EMIHUDRAFT_216066 [Emiliania huxleyi CCMP1516]|eukprot:XP_005762394.1 hypothetical protein EMIHUDRAFT_216066 [Emiliania huxleyi CCMP1516]